MGKVGFVVCSRTDSARLPNKPFRNINGVPVIEHLVHRLQQSNIPTCITVPEFQSEAYDSLSLMDNVYVHWSKHYLDPLARMLECAEFFKLDTVIRVSHDKIFVEPKDIEAALAAFAEAKADYLYGSGFIPGTGFEIISTTALRRAAKKYKNVEYIGYSVRSVTDKIVNFKPKQPRGTFRFLIDYEQDLKLFDILFSQLGNDITLNKAISYLNNNPELKSINALPELTIYTCAYNAAEFLPACMESVSKQVGFKDIEYILIDDHSTDSTCELMAKFCIKNKNAKWIRNDKNLGLSSSSNIALKAARGKYIMRLDADDFFVSIHASKDMVKHIQQSGKEALYPHNYFGSLNLIQKGKEHHHAGGAIFDKTAINHVKFTDGLMGHDSLDIFLRAKNQLKIGYFTKPTFFYRQHAKSMSKNNLTERAKIKRRMVRKHKSILKAP